MKVLWITNILFAHHLEMMGKDSNRVSGGTWLYAAYEASRCNDSIQLHIATVSNVAETKVDIKDGNSFYILPGGNSINYDIKSQSNLENWNKLRRDINPDVIIVWGTETRFAYLAMKAMHGIPTAIYMQGAIGSIYEHYYEGVPHKYKLCTLRDVINKFNQKSQINNFKHQVSLERKMIGMANAVIVENDWCEDFCRSINPKLNVYRNMLPIRDVFYRHQWSVDRMKRQTIFTNAGGYPIKGHHILFQALAIVKKKYPDFVCCVPGAKLSTFDNFKRQTGYMKWLKRLIEEKGLAENVVYTGPLTSEQMAEYISNCNVYVMPSIVENHSSSLIEAMIIGAPVVSSLVGGCAELIAPKLNGFLYNSLDAESLAGNIIRIFEDEALTRSLAKNALKTRQIRKRNFGDEMNEIYSLLVNR